MYFLLYIIISQLQIPFSLLNQLLLFFQDISQMFLPHEIHADLEQDKFGSMLFRIPMNGLFVSSRTFFPCSNDVLLKLSLW